MEEIVDGIPFGQFLLALVSLWSYCLIFKPEAAFAIFGLIATHELGHAFFARRGGATIKGIYILPWMAYHRSELNGMTGVSKCLQHLGGVISMLLFGYLLIVLETISGNKVFAAGAFICVLGIARAMLPFEKSDGKMVFQELRTMPTPKIKKLAIILLYAALLGGTIVLYVLSLNGAIDGLRLFL